MRYPELIFVFICLVLIGYLVSLVFKFRKQKNVKPLIKGIIISVLIIAFSFIWFVPIYVGQKGEAPVCKFRFKAYSFESDDYGGYGTFNDLFFKIMPNEYGTMYFITEEGGWKEYFGLKTFEYQRGEAYFKNK
ncbi:hypothetical protein A8C32_09865 [Flavivirga aquatica]|uniref:Uncharacterized protein n=1 Tax=Flavivirga aquatica TaxID=1849968 RepID=A0A1E5TEP1_9FLAO|nr:hypothetical protein [Flavivirga aquatica]OEK09808.1 hypothetical protein A8C32_09865 [Flavivirga aquatica]